MYLSRLYIENYRSVQKADLKFERGKNIIVGRNNSGKSNILKAIDLILGEYSPTYNKSENLTDNDFYLGKTNIPIFIWCEINRDCTEKGILEPLDFSSVAKSAFYKLYNDRDCHSEIRVKVTDFKRAEKLAIFNYSTERGQASLDEGNVFKKWVGEKKYCKGWSFDKEFSDKSCFAIAFFAHKPIDGELKKEMVFLFKETKEDDWAIGLNCNIRNILLQSAVIPAFRDPKDQLRISAYSWFGKLLKAYVKTDDKDLKDAFSAVKDASNKLFSDLQEKVSGEEINIAFPNTTISFQFNPDTKQDIHKSTLIYVNDGFNSELKDKGAGIQSAVTISLYDFYVQNVAHRGSSLLAVEEPELYLHPHGRRVIANRLSKFVNNGKNQVIITTHTPEFLSNMHETQNIIAVRKEEAATSATNIYFNTPKRKQILIKKQNAEMFFADAVILTEGADKYFVEEAARIFGRDFFYQNEDKRCCLGENWINDFNISILNCGGKTELWKYVEILRELNIKYITTADFDFLREGLNDYFTKLNYQQGFSDRLNSLKSKIATVVIKGKYKHIKQIGDETLIKEVEDFLYRIIEEDIFIFTGELENFYIENPSFDKEGGVIQTLGRLLEESKTISELVDISEYLELFENFVSLNLGFKRHIENNKPRGAKAITVTT